MVRPCQARIVLLSSIFGMSQAITCPTASKCFLWGSLGQQLVKVHKWWSYSTWGWKWKNMLQIYANISRNFQEEAIWTETIFVFVDGGLWCLMSFLVFAIWYMDIYAASRASVQACDMAFPSTEMGMAMKRELKKHKPPISLGGFNPPWNCTYGFVLGKIFFNRRTIFF